MATLKDLIKQVRDNLQDYTAAYVSDTMITNYLNEAQVKLSQVSFGVDSFPVSVTAGTDYVSRPASLLAPQKAYFRVQDSQWELDISHGLPEDTEVYSGYPDTAYFAGSKIYLRPVPGSDGTLTIAGTSRPAGMTAQTDTPSFQDADDILAAYATWKGYALIYAGKKDRDSFNLMQEWNQTYTRMRQEWGVLDAQKNPSTSRVQREWWE